MFFQQQAELIGWRDRVGQFDLVDPWKPHALLHGAWPPNYRGVYAWRIETLNQLREDPNMLRSAMAWYSTRPADFIMHWMDTYNPRKVDNKWIPFVFFDRQREVVDFIHGLRQEQESGLVEKCRDAGVTWLACGYSAWSLIFIPDDAIGWGSRKEELVDKLGDADSIFEKIRLIFQRMPRIFMPRVSMQFKKFINHDNGSTVIGEAGDGIGRGGRKSVYFKDESAHYARPELIEASLGDNTNVQVDISSVNGIGNPFHRRREAGVEWSPGLKIEKGVTRVFVFDWRHHPEKTQEWYDRRRKKYEREGMLHLFAQEVDRDYAASVTNTVIPAKWIQAAIDAHIKIPHFAEAMKTAPDVWAAGLDIADGGVDLNALVLRQWVIWRNTYAWTTEDVGETTRIALNYCKPYPGITIEYDAIGVGSGVKSEYNRLVKEKEIKPSDYQMSAWNAGASVIDPFERIIPDDEQSVLNKDYFANFKAQSWWSLRTRFYKTWSALTTGTVYPVEEMISLDSNMNDLQSTIKELSQATHGQSSGLRLKVNKAPEGTKSPNRADGGVQAFNPAPSGENHAISGRFSV